MFWVDSVYVTYSTVLTWGNLASEIWREYNAIWFRQRRQWALLAGQLFNLSSSIDKADSNGKGEKELVLMAWCKTEAPILAIHPKFRNQNLTSESLPTNISSTKSIRDILTELHSQNPSPGWSTLIRTRRIACFLPFEATEDQMSKVELDIYADLNPVS